jgi:uncharacterized protein YbjQ (UPF0145 family)
MILTNIETVPGKTIVEHYGLVQGSTIRAKNVGKDLMAGLKNLVGGELKGYTELLLESRAEATERMVAQATELGANAIVNVRFATSSVSASSSAARTSVATTPTSIAARTSCRRFPSSRCAPWTIHDRSPRWNSRPAPWSSPSMPTSASR